MAKFNEAYKKILENEGLYSNDPDDKGGETWKGIARNKWPNWDGWKVIDSYKGKPNFVYLLISDTNLETLVFSLYKRNFWDAIRGDDIHNQAIADSICDSAVNMGVVAGIKIAQQSLGLPETGKMNKETLNKINDC